MIAMPRLRNKDIDSVITEEFDRCKNFVVNVMGYKTVENVQLVIDYSRHAKQRIEGWANPRGREVGIVVPDLLTDNVFYIDYVIGHELGHIIAYDEGCVGNTEGIAEFVGAYVSYSFSGSKSLKEDIIKALANFSTDPKNDPEGRLEVLRTKEALCAYNGDISEFIKLIIRKKQLREIKRQNGQKE